MPHWRVPLSNLLLFVAMVIIMHPQQASAKLHLTYHGTICIGSCNLQGDNKYYCDSIDRGETTVKSMLCSSENQMTVTGQKCRDQCGQSGKDYYWCHTGVLIGWDYCGLVKNNTDYVTSKYGAVCYDECGTGKQNYYWCHTRKGWDYCSPRPNVDYYNNPCKADHPCAKHDESYYWCNLQKRSWDYCGPHVPKMLLFRSSQYRQICIENCKYYSSGKYYYCHTSKGWDYCSPVPDVTYKGVPCRDQHSCDRHGESYYWCYTDKDNNWNYCGVIEGSQCEYSVSEATTKRRSPPGQNQLQCFPVSEDRGNLRRVDFLLNPNANIAEAGGSQTRNDVQNIVNMWDNTLLTDRAGTLVRTETFRIDMQGMVNRGGVRYHNLQIQRNVKRQSGQSTTYSQVLVPENQAGVTSRYVRRAFLQSFYDRVGITIQVSDLQRQAHDLSTADQNIPFHTPSKEFKDNLTHVVKELGQTN